MREPQPRSRADLARGERFQRGLFHAFAALALFSLLVSIGSALWAKNELTQVESVIALQLRMIDEGEPLYRDTGSYPFTISPYGPLYYDAALALYRTGLSGFLPQRLLSILALLAVVFLSVRVAWRITHDKRAAATAGLLTASTALLLRWGSTGQSDMPALALSLWAFERYLAWRDSGQKQTAALLQSGLGIALAIFTKQSFVAAGAAIALLTIAADRRAGLRFTAWLAAAGVATAAALEVATGGAFLEHTLRSHDNGFAWKKMADHLAYFGLVSGPLWTILAASSFRLGRRSLGGLHLYLALAVAVFLGTAGKYGSDLNYQIESFVLLAIAAACALKDLDFYRLRAAGDPSWVTLLEIPLALYLVVNAAVAGQAALHRVVRESQWREQAQALQPYLAPERGRVLSVELNPLVSTRGALEVEPLIYTLLVDAGRIDGRRVLQDIQDGAFGVVILYEDLSRPQASKSPELPTLPSSHLAAVREKYRLTAHVQGPLVNGVYVYEPLHTDRASASPGR